MEHVLLKFQGSKRIEMVVFDVDPKATSCDVPDETGVPYAIRGKRFRRTGRVDDDFGLAIFIPA